MTLTSCTSVITKTKKWTSVALLMGLGECIAKAFQRGGFGSGRYFLLELQNFMESI